MKSATYVTVVVMMLSLVAVGSVSGNNVLAKKYLPGEIPTGSPNTADVKKKSLDEIRALAEQAKKDALEKFQKENPAKQSKQKQNDEKQKAMDAAKAEMKKKTDAALAALKAKKK